MKAEALKQAQKAEAARAKEGRELQKLAELKAKCESEAAATPAKATKADA